MNVAVSIQHPAHVHLFRHAIQSLEADGHTVSVYARGKEFISELLSSYDIDHEVLTPESSSVTDLLRTQLRYEYRLWRRLKPIDPDVVVAVGGLSASHVATALGCRSLVFTDTEHATLQNALAFPLADRICTPDCYRDDLGTKQYRYPGYHELAYLHPDRFAPDPSVFEELRIEPEDPFVVLRSVSWNAAHDVGAGGFGDLAAVVDRLEATGVDVLLTAEGQLPSGLERYRTTVPADRIHDVLAFADLFLGESGTMAIESAVLGTPAVVANSLEGIGVFEELEEQYELLYHFSDEQRHEASVRTALDLLDTEADHWQRNRERLLADKVDTTDVILDQVLRPH